MKPEIHPEYRDVVFLDTQNGTSFITRSTIRTEETTEVDGVEYPLAKVEISATSHPFYTGTMTIIDTAGRVERFEKRYGRRKQKAAAAEEAAPAEDAPAAEDAAPAEDAAAAEAPEAEETGAEAVEAEAAAAEEAVAEAPAEAVEADEEE